jgi:hypothetical protein
VLAARAASSGIRAQKGSLLSVAEKRIHHAAQEKGCNHPIQRIGKCREEEVGR